MLLTNPYKLTTEELKELRCEVSESDFQHLYALFPRRGLIDGVLSQLFCSFMRRVKSSIPLPESCLEFPTKEAELQHLLSKLYEPTDS